MFDYDVVFIGSGHACWHGAATLVSQGKKVAVIDEGVLGGTCTNYGCDAKILLDGPFEHLAGLQNYKSLCVDSTPNIDWTALMAYKKQNIGALGIGMEGMLTQFGIEIKRGHASLVDEHTVAIGDSEKVTSEYIVIGAGQRNARLDIPGKEYLHGSRDFLDLDVMPERLVFIGAGIISMEFASMALKLGKKVTFIEFAPRALAAYPKKYVDKLVELMKAEGAEFKFGEAVSEVAKTDSGFVVRTKSGFEAEADYVLDATGRLANVENLGLDALGIESSRRGIVVDDHLRTAVKNIYASGDVIDKKIPKLTPTAAFESDYIAAQILGFSDAPIKYPAIPNLVFTLPRIAQVGVTVEEAEESPEEYRIAEIPYGQFMLWLAKNETDVNLTLIFDKTKHLVGAAIYGSEAGTWIDILTMIINLKLGAAQLSQMIFAFPTSSYGLISVLLPQFLL